MIPLKDMVHDLEAIAAAVTEHTRLIFLDNPNNPCATLVSKEAFAAFLAKLPEEVVVHSGRGLYRLCRAGKTD
nr:hypothetical protein [Candidatus Electrothrix aestuarii]